MIILGKSFVEIPFLIILVPKFKIICLKETRNLDWFQYPKFNVIYTLQLAKCQGNPCLKQALYLKFKWSQWDSKSFNQTDQIIELYCKYLSVWYVWLNVLIMSRMRFKVNLHSKVAWISRKSLLKTDAICKV